jgi:hypothetical protein
MLICAQYVGKNGLWKWRRMVPVGAFCGARALVAMGFDIEQDRLMRP